jgi:hypothetical protein
MTTYRRDDGCVVASSTLRDGRVLRVVGNRDSLPHPCSELFKTLSLLGEDVVIR